MPDPMFKREVCGAAAEADLNSEYGTKMRQLGRGDAGKGASASRSKRSETSELDRQR
jgi:hypothetical protein